MPAWGKQFQGQKTERMLPSSALSREGNYKLDQHSVGQLWDWPSSFSYSYFRHGLEIWKSMKIIKYAVWEADRAGAIQSVKPSAFLKDVTNVFAIINLQTNLLNTFITK